MNKKQLRQFICAGRVGYLASASADGAPNCAVIGSATMPDDNHLLLGLGDNRTLDNLRHNGRAVFTVAEAGESITRWQGARLYLHVAEIATDGALKEQVCSAIAAAVGSAAADAIAAAVYFEITAIRPLLAFSR